MALSVNISMIPMKDGTFVLTTTALNITMAARPQQSTGNAIGHSKQIRITLYLSSHNQKNDRFHLYSQIIYEQQNMNQKTLLFICIIALLSNVISSQKHPNRGNSDRSRPHEGRANSSTFIPPNIRKCMGVKCPAGQFCFHGRCKKIDYECLNLKCEKGFRCNKGACVKQMHEPRKQLCKPLGFQQEKLECGAEQQKRCLQASAGGKVCAFQGNRRFEQFENQCIACSSHYRIRFYFQASCQWAPRVCSESEQCLNGACVELFNENIFENHRTCNQNADCKPNERCAGHKCVDKRDVFNYLMSKSETNQIGLVI